MELLANLETFAPSAASIINIRNSPDLAKLNRQWQLPVYFQLRWKDITSTLEQSLERPVASKEWLIPQTGSVYLAVEACWAEDIHIQELADRFYKLTLQVSLSVALAELRYCRGTRDGFEGWYRRMTKMLG
jgi:hypothetical protein